jgi:hypothetical protein
MSLSIYVTERLTWHGKQTVIKCLTARLLTDKCRHPAHPFINPAARNVAAASEPN